MILSALLPKKMQQYRQNQIVLHALTKASQPWLQKCHTYGVFGLVKTCRLYYQSLP